MRDAVLSRGGSKARRFAIASALVTALALSWWLSRDYSTRPAAASRSHDQHAVDEPAVAAHGQGSPHRGPRAETDEPSTRGSEGAVRLASPAPGAQATDDVLMARARAALHSDPARALDLVREADETFGVHHEERRLIEIEALVGLERIGLSHAKAAAFYRAFPASALRAEVERLTGYHPRPPGHE